MLGYDECVGDITRALKSDPSFCSSSSDVLWALPEENNHSPPEVSGESPGLCLSVEVCPD